jgi:hypothetical protein
MCFYCEATGTTSAAEARSGLDGPIKTASNVSNTAGNRRMIRIKSDQERASEEVQWFEGSARSDTKKIQEASRVGRLCKGPSNLTSLFVARLFLIV